jgi:cobyrinic acid a,c-diamide synthase
MGIPRLVIAGTHSGVGKTTVTLAILSALKARGRRVQAFKVGPDFIDPGHHTLATDRPSRNLDGWMLAPDVNLDTFRRATADADVAIIEGVMGLFDGSSPVNEVGSTAEMAKRLGAPVLLVIDGSAMARSAAAMAQGFARFDPELKVAGILFNRVGSDGHYRLLKEAVEATTDLKVVGYFLPDEQLAIGDRHLGLVTAIEQGAGDRYERLGAAAEAMLDLDLIEALARAAVDDVRGEAQGGSSTPRASPVTPHEPVRVGLAYDPAFCFYYAENLERLEEEGATLVPFSPTHDRALPDVDLLYLGGGYPELYAAALAGNTSMKEAIKAFAAAGGPIYAECGGLMYLLRAIRDFEGRSHEMVGLFPAMAVMQRSGMTLGYREVEVTTPCLLGAAGTKVRGHEFHYSALFVEGPLDYAVRLTDARGHVCGKDALVTGRVAALYTHLHFASQPAIARALVEAARLRALAAAKGSRPA